ncbi:MAG: hypothetical protein HOV87_21295 [Catenulispora sp.]|nr:hypothetical protein [Catenulispora sp.]
MRSSHLRKSLAASAIFATSVASAAGLVQSANASTAGAANSPLTITNGTQTVELNGRAVQYSGKIDQGSWAPDGSRIAYVRADNAVVTERAGGGDLVVVAPPKAGVTRSHPTWVAGGSTIVFAEKSGSTSKVMSVAAYTDPHDAVVEGSPISLLVSKMVVGTESAPESNGQTLAMQHTVGGHEEIWVQDSFGRGSGGPIEIGGTVDGTDPTVSPDGKAIAFVRADGSGNQQIWTVAWNGQDATPSAGTPVQLTHDAHDHLHPTWSPDGSRIAYENGPGAGAAATDVQSIAKDGSGQRQEWNAPGVPAYQGQNRDSVTRLAGTDRIGTAIAASVAQWPKAPYKSTGYADPKTQAGSVVLSRSDLPYDALGGATLATVTGGPLLLTPTDHLDAGVKAEITRALGAPSSTNTVYVLGGEQALSPAVFNAVKDMGYTVKRIAGEDRFSTSVAIAKEVTARYGAGGQPERILVATGKNFPDALSAGAAAEASTGESGPNVGVVVLTDDTKIPAATAAYLAQNAAHAFNGVYGVGGQADTALTNAGIKHTKVAGENRFQTSYLVAKTFFGKGLGGNPPRKVGFATGLNWADALSGGAFMGHVDGPLLLVDGGGEPSKDAENWLLGWAPSIDSGYIFGGEKAVPDVATVGLPGLYAGPASVTVVANPKA